MESFMAFCGWMGALLLGTCGLPQMVTTLRTRRFEGLSLLFVLWWFLGELFSITYVIYKLDWPLIVNFSFNIAICIVILWVYVKYQILNPPGDGVIEEGAGK